jgi:lipopolysaccharide/colanic/teichoic acid biosynthesis glycosyltransferase/nucleoside-diphosphate-sugar epimerase
MNKLARESCSAGGRRDQTKKLLEVPSDNEDKSGVMKRRVLVTGATGFVGHSLCPVLHRAGWIVRATWVHTKPQLSDEVEWRRVDPLGPDTDWSGLLEGIDYVVHLAAVAHRVGALAEPSEGEYDKANHLGTARLAEQVKAVGSIQRLVFMSSIGAVTSLTETPVNEATVCQPDTRYGRSKLAGETVVRQILDGSSTNWCILRPPLVYGPGNPGNMARLLRLLDLPVPLPLGSVRNRRTFIYVGNLVDAIRVALDHPGARNRLFCLGDDETLSTPAMLQRLGAAAQRPVRLWSCPRVCLDALGIIGTLIGKIAGRSLGMDRTAIGKLCGSLSVDSRRFREACGWLPPVPTDEGLRLTVTMSRSAMSEGKSPSQASSISLMRTCDVIFSAGGLVLLAPVILLLALMGLFDTGSPFFRQVRVGIRQKPFTLMKFRTMKLNTASVPSHLVSASAVSGYGRFLRHTKLDELPQLWNVLRGDMSLVGPRPGLFNQQDLTQARLDRGIFNVRPGITGLAQVSNIDMSTPQLLAETDERMVRTLTLRSYFRYILLTVTGKGSGDGVKDTTGFTY